MNWNLSAPDGLSSVKLNWDNTNYSLYDSSLVLFMNFDNRSVLGENDTHVKDLSRYENNGTVYGGSNITHVQGCHSGGCFNFSGKINYIEMNMTYYMQPTKNYSVFMYIRTSDSSSGAKQLIGGATSLTANRSQLIIQSGYLKYNSNNVFYDPLQYVTDNSWHFVGVVFLNNNYTLYLDGEQIGLSQSAGLNGYSENVRIGGRITTEFFNGSIDNLMIWNRSLSASEISQLYNSQLTKYDSQNWSIFINKTDLLSSTKVNATNPTYLYNYQLCVSNLSNSENCSTLKSITQTIPVKNIITNFSSSIGSIRDDFYGIKDYHIWFSNPFNTSQTGIHNSSNVNTTWNRQTFLDSGMTSFNQRVYLNFIFSNNTQQWDINISDIPMLNAIAEEVEWASDNDIKMYISIVNMPTYLQNRSSPYCNSTYWFSCPSNNWTAYNEMILYLLNNITNKGEHHLEGIVVGNEPYFSSSSLTADVRWCNNLSYDSITKATEYVKWFNYTYWNIKNNSTYSYLKVVGPTGFRDAPIMTQTFLSNQTIYMDGVAIHPYDYVNSGEQQYNDLSDLKALCDTYGANCSLIYAEEYWIGSNQLSHLAGNNSYYYNYLMNLYSQSYILNLNYLPSNISMAGIWHWSENSPVLTDYSVYGYYEGIVDQPIYYNASRYLFQYKPAYNVTKNFAHLHRAGDTVTTSTSDYSNIKSVASKYSNSFYAVTIINSGTDSTNQTVTLVNYPYSSIKNYETGEVYDVVDGVVQLGILDSYQILYLTGTNGNLTNYNKLNENSGTISYDASGNTNHGTIFSSTWSNDGILNTISSLDYSFTNPLLSLINADYFYDYFQTTFSKSLTRVDLGSIKGNYSQSQLNIINKYPQIGTIIGIFILLTILIGVIIFAITRLINIGNFKSNENSTKSNFKGSKREFG